MLSFVISFTDTPTTNIYTLSLHDALPILRPKEAPRENPHQHCDGGCRQADGDGGNRDRKSTRLNSSHRCSSYAVFCLKKKKKIRLEAYSSAGSAGGTSLSPWTNRAGSRQD